MVEIKYLATKWKWVDVCPLSYLFDWAKSSWGLGSCPRGFYQVGNCLFMPKWYTAVSLCLVMCNVLNYAQCFFLLFSDDENSNDDHSIVPHVWFVWSKFKTLHQLSCQFFVSPFSINLIAAFDFRTQLGIIAELSTMLHPTKLCPQLHCDNLLIDNYFHRNREWSAGGTYCLHCDYVSLLFDYILFQFYSQIICIWS